MRTWISAGVVSASIFCCCLATSTRAAAQTQGFQAGATLGATGTCASRTDCGPGFTMGWFLNGDRSARRLPVDGQAEVFMGAQGTTERQGFGRAALLLRLKSSAHDLGDPSPRLHLLAGPQVEFHSTTQLAGVGGPPDVRLALGVDVVQRRTIVELRYTAHVGVRHDPPPTAVMVSPPRGASAPPPPPSAVSAPRSSLVFRDGAVVLTVGLRVGG